MASSGSHAVSVIRIGSAYPDPSIRGCSEPTRWRDRLTPRPWTTRNAANALLVIANNVGRLRWRCHFAPDALAVNIAHSSSYRTTPARPPACCSNKLGAQLAGQRAGTVPGATPVLRRRGAEQEMVSLSPSPSPGATLSKLTNPVNATSVRGTQVPITMSGTNLSGGTTLMIAIVSYVQHFSCRNAIRSQ
jgi:hypothetical protein